MYVLADARTDSITAWGTLGIFAATLLTAIAAIVIAVRGTKRDDRLRRCPTPPASPDGNRNALMRHIRISVKVLTFPPKRSINIRVL